MFCSHKREKQSTDTYYKLDKPPKHTRWKKLEAKVAILWVLLYTISMARKFIGTKHRPQVGTWLGGGIEQWWFNG